MGRPAIAASAVLVCPHGGQAAIVSSSARVLAGGVPIVAIGDGFLVSGCANVSMPCVAIEWQVSAARVRIGGRPPILKGDMGRTISALGMTGTVIDVADQTRVSML